MTADRPQVAASAIDIASGVRKGELSAVDVLEEHLARVAEREPDVHAFNFVMTDHARPGPARSTVKWPPAGTPAPSPACPWP